MENEMERELRLVGSLGRQVELSLRREIEGMTAEERQRRGIERDGGPEIWRRPEVVRSLGEVLR